MSNTIDIAEGSLKEGILSLILALVEVIADALRVQALRRMEGGRLSDGEVESLGRALHELDRAVEEIEADLGLAAAVASVRRSLDRAVEDLLVRNLDLHP